MTNITSFTCLKLLLTFTLIFAQIYQSESHLYFQIFPNRQRCYLEELFDGSVLLIKWKITMNEMPEDPEELTKQLNQLKINIYKEENNENVGILLKTEIIQTLIGTTTLNSKSEATYKICVGYQSSNWHYPTPTYMSLKFASDNMDEPNLQNAVKSEEVNFFHKKTVDVLQTTDEFINRQKKIIDLEEKSAKECMEKTVSYYNLAVFQIIVVVGLGLYQVFSFKKFLVKNAIV